MAELMKRGPKKLDDDSSAAPNQNTPAFVQGGNKNMAVAGVMQTPLIAQKSPLKIGNRDGVIVVDTNRLQVRGIPERDARGEVRFGVVGGNQSQPTSYLGGMKKGLNTENVETFHITASTVVEEQPQLTEAESKNKALGGLKGLFNSLVTKPAIGWVAERLGIKDKNPAPTQQAQTPSGQQAGKKDDDKKPEVKVKAKVNKQGDYTLVASGVIEK